MQIVVQHFFNAGDSLGNHHRVRGVWGGLPAGLHRLLGQNFISVKILGTAANQADRAINPVCVGQQNDRGRGIAAAAVRRRWKLSTLHIQVVAVDRQNQGNTKTVTSATSEVPLLLAAMPPLTACGGLRKRL